MKKKERTLQSRLDMAATTTSWDWGFKPVPGKGGATKNCEGSDTIIYREQKEADKE